MKNIVITGNVGGDAEQRTTQNGDDVCSFNVAVADKRRKETIWFTVSYWGRGGQNVCDYIKKGNQITVSGDLFTKEYNGKTYININAQSVTLGKRSNEAIDTNPSNQSNHIDDDDEIPF